jgi:hypothetical protein
MLPNEPRLGLYLSKELSNEEYHKDSALGSSQIKELFHTKKLYGKKKYSSNSDSMRMGSAFHSLLLEGKKVFLSEYKIRKTKRGKRFYGKGDNIISLANFQKISDWCRNIPKALITLGDNEVTAQSLLDSDSIKDIKTECSYFWINDLGIRCKVRFDMLINNMIIIDPKSMSNWKSIDLDKCINDTIAKLDYNISAVYYLDGLNHYRESLGLKKLQCAWYWIFAESEAPYRTVFKKMPTEWIEPTRVSIDVAFMNYLELKETGLRDERYTDIIYTEEMPYWWKKKYNIGLGEESERISP